ncbi:MAG: hypothetical protein M1816_006497 [Peltula sp. TS41687]|nr:MAG: hypothetical protein M1816_006497 [Peltula sp. TS41687]
MDFARPNGVNPIQPSNGFCDCGQELPSPPNVTTRPLVRCRSCSWNRLLRVVHGLDKYIKAKHDPLRWIVEEATLVFHRAPNDRRAELVRPYTERYQRQSDFIRSEIKQLYEVQLQHFADFVNAFADFTPDERRQWEDWKAKAQIQMRIEEFETGMPKEALESNESGLG